MTMLSEVAKAALIVLAIAKSDMLARHAIAQAKLKSEQDGEADALDNVIANMTEQAASSDAPSPSASIEPAASASVDPSPSPAPAAS